MAQPLLKLDEAGGVLRHKRGVQLFSSQKEWHLFSAAAVLRMSGLKFLRSIMINQRNLICIVKGISELTIPTNHPPPCDCGSDCPLCDLYRAHHPFTRFLHFSLPSPLYLSSVPSHFYYDHFKVDLRCLPLRFQ